MKDNLKSLVDNAHIVCKYHRRITVKIINIIYTDNFTIIGK